MRPTFVATLVKCDIVILSKGKVVEVSEGELSGMYNGLCKQSCVEKPVSTYNIRVGINHFLVCSRQTRKCS